MSLLIRRSDLPGPPTGIRLVGADHGGMPILSIRDPRRLDSASPASFRSVGPQAIAYGVHWTTAALMLIVAALLIP
jgi:hypothetical protein